MLGSLFGDSSIAAGINLAGTYMTNVANAKIAKSQMDFQATMSSTAHQREVQDLRAAGLNPILSSKYGGSSTPPGAGIPSQSYGNVGSDLVSAARTKAEIKLMKDQSWLAQSSAAKANQEAHESYARQHVLYETQKKEREAAEAMVWDAKSARWRYESDKAQGEFDRSIGEESRYGRFLLEILKGVSPGFRPRVPYR